MIALPRILLSVLVSAVLAVLANPAFAGGVQKHPTFKPQITEIGPKSISVKTGEHAGYKQTKISTDGLTHVEGAANVVTYAVTDRTAITINRKPAKLTDLKN